MTILEKAFNHLQILSLVILVLNIPRNHVDLNLETVFKLQLCIGLVQREFNVAGTVAIQNNVFFLVVLLRLSCANVVQTV